MNRLPPAFRDKHRYIAVQVHSEENMELGDVVEAVWDSSLNFLGSKDTSKADIWIIGNKFDESLQRGVIRVEKTMIEDFRSSLALIEFIGNEKGFIEVKGISGTLEAIENKYF